MLELFFSRGVVFVMFVSTIVENQNSVGGFSCPSHTYRRQRNIRWGGGKIYGITLFWRTIIAVGVYAVAVYSSWPAYQDPHGDFWNTPPNSRYPSFKEQKMQFSEEFFFLFFALLRQISRIRRRNSKIPVRVLVSEPWAINRYHIHPHSYGGSSEQGYAIEFTSSSSCILFSSVFGWIACKKMAGLGIGCLNVSRLSTVAFEAIAPRQLSTHIKSRTFQGITSWTKKFLSTETIACRPFWSSTLSSHCSPLLTRSPSPCGIGRTTTKSTPLWIWIPNTGGLGQ